MKPISNRSTFAQNRIDYIVYSNPKGVSQFLYDYGYEPPENLHDLVKATKILVQQKGKKAIKELIQIHPDRKAILNTQNKEEDNYCGVCNSYAYQPEDSYCGQCGHSNYSGSDDAQEGFLDTLTAMETTTLEAFYENILKKSNANPQDTTLAEQVQTTWNELRQRKKHDNQEEKETPKQNPRHEREGLIILGLVFIAGIWVGLTLKTPKR